MYMIFLLIWENKMSSEDKHLSSVFFDKFLKIKKTDAYICK